METILIYGLIWVEVALIAGLSIGPILGQIREGTSERIDR